MTTSSVGFDEIIVQGTRGVDKTVSFTNNGITNLKQKRYFNSMFYNNGLVKPDYSEFYYGGAFRCGKSASQQLAVYLLAVRYPGLKILYVRDTYDELKVSVIKQFNDEFEYLGAYTYLKSERTATFEKTEENEPSSVIYFRAFNYDTDILSAEYDVICACQVEDLPKELFLQFFGRLSGKILPSPLLLAEGNPSGNYIKDRYKDPSQETLKSQKIFAITDGKTSDNPFVMPGYIDRIKANYPAWWIARYLEGEWNNIDEMVFSEFRESRDVIDPVRPEIVKNFKQRAGLDYGWRNPSAVIWGYIDYDDNITIYDEWEAAQQTPIDIKRAAFRHGKLVIAADYSIKRPDRDGRSLWDELTKQDGLILTESNKNELDNIILINTLLKQGRLKITRNCINLITEILNYKWKRIKLGQDKNLPDEPIQKDNHCIDAMLYMIADLIELKSENPSKIAMTKTIAWANERGFNKQYDGKKLS